MKKQIITVIGLTTLLVNQSFGQFSATPGLLPTAQSIGANVGIGTGSPNAKLEVLTTANQFRLSNTASIFNDFNTNASGYLTIMPSNATTSRIGFNTTTPLTGFHINMGTLRLTDPSSSTRAFQVTPSYPGNGDIPAGTLIMGTSTTANEGLSFIPSGSGTAGVKLGAYAYSPSGWKSVWETANVNSGSPNLLLVKNGGSIGIGTGGSAPASHLDMVNNTLGYTAGNNVQWLKLSGDAGGTSDNLKIFHNRVSNGSTWYSSEIKIQKSVNGVNHQYISFRGDQSNQPSMQFGFDNTDFMSISNLGQVAIGTKKSFGNHSDALLSVYGKALFKSIYVNTSSAVWADYVFEKNYKLIPLNEVESYYKTNKHLIDFKSAKEYEAEGVNIVETQALLLKKIEELTLYIVELDKQVKQLQQSKK